MAIQQTGFGRTPRGEEVTRYTMTNARGASVSMIDYGATIVSILVPDQNGKLADVALGFDDLGGYLQDHGHMGETIGRYGNRIARGEWTIDGVTYHGAINDGPNHLHGGAVGFGEKMWAVQVIEQPGTDTLRFHRLSPDGEEGYPGNLDVTVSYSWNDSCDLIIRYEATTDKATLCNLTNHVYLNLGGHDSGSIGSHVLYVDADVVTPVAEGLIPTGGYLPVAGTPFDLREDVTLGEGLKHTQENEQLRLGNGYDHNYVLRKGGAMGLAAALHHEGSGRTVEVLTDQPGMQLYTGNYLSYTGKGGAVYGANAGLCLETQHYPDSPHNPQWSTTVLRPGEKYDTTTIYAFRVDA